MAKKNNSVKKLVVVSALGGTIWYLLNRTKIQIVSVDKIARKARVKIAMGLKTLDLLLSAFDHSGQYSISKTKILKVNTRPDGSIIELIIVDKNVTVDNFVIDFKLKGRDVSDALKSAQLPLIQPVKIRSTVFD